MEQRDSVDRVSSEAPVSASALTSYPNGSDLNGGGPDPGNETSPVVDSVLQSDVRPEVTVRCDFC